MTCSFIQQRTEVPITPQLWHKLQSACQMSKANFDSDKRRQEATRDLFEEIRDIVTAAHKNIFVLTTALKGQLGN